MGGLCLEKRLHDRLVPRVRLPANNDCKYPKACIMKETKIK